MFACHQRCHFGQAHDAVREIGREARDGAIEGVARACILAGRDGGHSLKRCGASGLKSLQMRGQAELVGELHGFD